MQFKKTLLIISLMTCSSAIFAQMGWIEGTIKDDEFNETLPGAAIQIDGTTRGVISDFNGKFKLENLAPGKHRIKISFISFEPIVEEIVVASGKGVSIEKIMSRKGMALQQVEVVARRRSDGEVALMNTIKLLPVVASGISAQMIRLTQDRDAGEAVKRIPGVSIVGDRFIVLRGLSQRYNTVWINQSVAPSSEADQRAFSFDVIPGSLIDNILIAKSSLPEYPADFAGGFIKIKTKGVGTKEGFSISLGSGYDSQSTGGTFLHNPAGTLSYLGFNDGTLDLPKSANESFTTLNPSEEYDRLEQIARSFNAHWEPQRKIAAPDLRLSASLAKRIYHNGAAELNTLTHLNFSNSSLVEQKEVTQWGLYDQSLKQPVYLSYNDQNINKQSAKLSLLHNWVWRMNIDHQLEFRNFVNNIASNRVIERYQDKNPNIFKGVEMSFSRRLTYTGELSGEHFITKENRKLDWAVGYSFADKSDPDQKQYEYERGEEGWFLPVRSTFNFFRINNYLQENLLSASVNYSHKFKVMNRQPELKGGLYIESKDRSFDNRWFAHMPSRSTLFFEEQSPNQIMGGDYFFNSKGGIRIKELTERSDSYTAQNNLSAGYLQAMLPIFKPFSITGGVRLEHNRQQLNGFQQSTGTEAVALRVNNNTLDLFPSIMASYQINKKNQLRLAYSTGTNRPEFREIAPYAYYDFENDVTINGNQHLKNCYTQGVDLRYEFYPATSGDLFSLATFFKRFTNIIELAQQGSTYPVTYNYVNVPSGDTYGIELEFRKQLAKKGFLKDFSVMLNASWIKSEVQYSTGYESRTRAMQGQSPYLINAGLFYNSVDLGLNANIVYNVIGARIVVNGDYSSVTPEAPNAYIPDIYEQPRNMIDFNISKTIRNVELKFSARDLLNQSTQWVRTYENGTKWNHSVHKTGTKLLLSATLNL